MWGEPTKSGEGEGNQKGWSKGREAGGDEICYRQSACTRETGSKKPQGKGHVIKRGWIPTCTAMKLEKRRRKGGIKMILKELDLTGYDKRGSGISKNRKA